MVKPAQSQSMWVKRLAQTTGSLVTIVAAVKEQGSIRCWDSFQCHTNRIIVSVDSASVFYIFRFFILLSESITSDILTRKKQLSLPPSRPGDPKDPYLGEPQTDLVNLADSSSSFPIPLFITKFYMSKIKLSLSVRFTNADETRGFGESELVTAYEEMAKTLIFVDIQDTRLALGALSGSGVHSIELEDKFLTKGTQDLTAQIISKISASLLFQSFVILGSPSIFGNLGQIVRAVSAWPLHPRLPFRSKLTIASYLLLQVVRRALAGFLLILHASSNSANGVFITLQKICTRVCLGTRVRLPLLVTQSNQSIQKTIQAGLRYSVMWFLLKTIDAWWVMIERHWYTQSSYTFLDILLFIWKLVSIMHRLFFAFWAGVLLTSTKFLTAYELLLARLISAISPLIGRLISDPPGEARYLNCFKAGQLQTYTATAASALEAVRGYCRDVDRRFWSVCALSNATFVILDSGAMYLCRGRTSKRKRISDGSHNWRTDTGGATGNSRLLFGSGSGETTDLVQGFELLRERPRMSRAAARKLTGTRPLLAAGERDEHQEVVSASKRRHSIFHRCITLLCARRRTNSVEKETVVWNLPETFFCLKVYLQQAHPNVVVFEGVVLRGRVSGEMLMARGLCGSSCFGGGSKSATGAGGQPSSMFGEDPFSSPRRTASSGRTSSSSMCSCLRWFGCSRRRQTFAGAVGKFVSTETRLSTRDQESRIQLERRIRERVRTLTGDEGSNESSGLDPAQLSGALSGGARGFRITTHTLHCDTAEDALLVFGHVMDHLARSKAN
ncbi:unnamed protein product [Amoebophrya sp. A25]|nr:unnamed protein product [Amoebophrya sp. A25]|eukprot:GSA25T00012090001.1